MNPIEIIDKFYPQDTEQRHILLIHSLSVAQKALKIVDAHPNLPINRSFVREAALLHDIGIFMTDAGLTLEEIIERQLPVPHREMVPVTLEEQIICFADKFFSKTHLDEEKTVEKARKSIAKYGEEGLNRFDGWCSLFL